MNTSKIQPLEPPLEASTPPSDSLSPSMVASGGGKSSTEQTSSASDRPLTPHTKKRDLITEGGILVVGLAAGILSFTTLQGLAESVGFRQILFAAFSASWLLPITIDAAGVISARIWLLAKGPDESVRFARALTWTCIIVSIAGNTGRHLMEAYLPIPPWWVVAIVSAIPPATLGAVVHLGNLVRRPPALQPPQPLSEEDITLTKVRTFLRNGASANIIAKSLKLDESHVRDLISRVNGHKS
jgi:Protein of unknown function (DUF2637)